MDLDGEEAFPLQFPFWVGPSADTCPASFLPQNVIIYMFNYLGIQMKLCFYKCQ